MFRKTRMEAVQEAVADVVPTTMHALEDEKVRARLGAALGHAVAATREARPHGTLWQLSRNRHLRAHVAELVHQLGRANKRLERQRRRRRLLAAGALLAPIGLLAVPRSRTWILERVRGAGGWTTIEEQIDVDVPLATAYNQWTQFEEFPLFMEGVDDVRQLDATRLRWTATIAGRRAEWEAKIVEQVPDSRITWVSTDGRDTRGTVTFEPLGSNRTRIRLVLTYTPEGAGEVAGSAAGIDSWRVRGDLDRFKTLIENRGTEDGAWRGEIHEGVRTS